MKDGKIKGGISGRLPFVGLDPYRRHDFEVLGLSVDDLIDAYVQTILSVIAIDKLCVRIAQPPSERLDASSSGDDRISAQHSFNLSLFAELNPDPVLIRELWA